MARQNTSRWWCQRLIALYRGYRAIGESRLRALRFALMALLDRRPE
jgi:hypothetical protein